MSEPIFFRWHTKIKLVYGISRAAIYHFDTGEVFSLNHLAAQIARLVDNNAPMHQMTANQRVFIEQLWTMGLGELSDTPARPEPEALPDGRPSLNFLWLEFDGCNLGCIHCYAESQNPLLFPVVKPRTAASPVMTFADWQGVLRQAAESGCRQVQFIGGEALLYPHLLRLIDAAQEDGYTFIEIYTNGTLLTERQVKALADRPVQLAVSLHGTEAEIHDTVTGVPGSFARTVTGLNRLREHHIPFRVAGTALRDNQHNILGVTEFAADLGATRASFDVVRAVGSGENPELMPDDPAVLEQKWLTWPDFVALRADYNHNRRWNPCWAGKLAVTGVGDVMPCIMGRSEVVGNIREESLTAILEKPRLLYLWGLTKDQVTVCRDCEYRYVCGDCRPLAAGGGDLHGAIPRCTYHPQTGVWGRPGQPAPAPGPAPEGGTAQIALATRRLYHQENGRSPSQQHPLRFRQNVNHHFGCDPDRKS